MSATFAGIAGANGRAPSCRSDIFDLTCGHASHVHPCQVFHIARPGVFAWLNNLRIKPHAGLVWHLQRD